MFFTSDFRVFAIALSLLMGTSALPAPAKDIILTNASAGRFLGSLAELQVIAASEGSKSATDGKGTSNPFQAILKAVKSSKLKDEVGMIVVKHGFANVQEWTDTGRALGQAYLYVTVGSMRGVAQSVVDKHKDTAMKELDKLGVLTDKQKKRLKENMAEASEELSREPPPENIAVVSTVKPAIEAAVKALKG